MFQIVTSNVFQHFGNSRHLLQLKIKEGYSEKISKKRDVTSYVCEKDTECVNCSKEFTMSYLKDYLNLHTSKKC